VVLASAKKEARLGATRGTGGFGTASAPRHAYHHTMPSRSGNGGPLDLLVARDLAGFTTEELRLLHREDEVAAMKAATAAIAAGEGELPLLPEEKRLAGLGAAAPGRRRRVLATRRASSRRRRRRGGRGGGRRDEEANVDLAGGRRTPGHQEVRRVPVRGSRFSGSPKILSNTRT
jgi:hypothetical protein